MTIVFARTGSRLAALVVGAALALASAVPAAAATITIATTPIDIGAQALWAKDAGFFTKAGLDVDIQLINNGAAIAAAVASGAVDVGQANIVSLATAHEKGLPFTWIAPGGFFDAADPTTALLVAKNAPFKNAKDLNGKTLAVSGIKNITQVGASAWLEANGADVSSIKWIELAFPLMAPAIASGRVDGAVIAEPELTEALDENARLFGNVYQAVGERFLIGAWFSRSAWAKDHPDLVKRFAAAIAETSQWANTHHDESAKILAKYTKQTVGSKTRRVRFATRLVPTEVQPLIDAAAKFSVLKAALPASEVITQ